MIKVLLYGEARLIFNVKEIEEKGSTVKELLSNLALRYDKKYKDLKKFLIYVNDVNITALRMFRTKLNDGDVIMMLSPSSGG